MKIVSYKLVVTVQDGKKFSDWNLTIILAKFPKLIKMIEQALTKYEKKFFSEGRVK